MVVTNANAYPALQLDILGGVYDTNTESVSTDKESFTLIALATPTGNTTATDILADTYYLSIGINSGPAQNSSYDAGSFIVNGNTVEATDAGMQYRTPPIDAAHNHNLPDHGIYPTYFHEVSFNFDPNDTTTSYNSQDDTGGILFNENGVGSFFVKFEISTGGLIGETLHFDLYNTALRNNGDVAVDNFAPFSHDAQTTFRTTRDDPNSDIPEPGSRVIFLFSLAILIYLRRYRVKFTSVTPPLAA